MKPSIEKSFLLCNNRVMVVRSYTPVIFISGSVMFLPSYKYLRYSNNTSNSLFPSIGIIFYKVIEAILETTMRKSPNWAFYTVNITAIPLPGR